MFRVRCLAVLVVLGVGSVVAAEEFRLSRAEVIDLLRPYQGESVPGVACDRMTGKVLCGYQGWFTTPGDGSGKGWSHYPRKGEFRPGSCSIDLWPDVSELDDDEKFATPFEMRTAEWSRFSVPTNARRCCGTFAGCRSTASTASSSSGSPWN